MYSEELYADDMIILNDYNFDYFLTGLAHKLYRMFGTTLLKVCRR